MSHVFHISKFLPAANISFLFSTARNIDKELPADRVIQFAIDHNYISYLQSL